MLIYRCFKFTYVSLHCTFTDALHVFTGRKGRDFASIDFKNSFGSATWEQN